MLTLEEVGNVLADSRGTVAGAISSYGADMLEEPLGALNNISLVAEVVDEDILLLEEKRVLEETEDLAEEGDGLLVKLLGVADVGRDDLVEGEVGGSTEQAGTELLGLDGKLATHSVLSRSDVRVDVVDGETAGIGGRHFANLGEGLEASLLRERVNSRRGIIGLGQRGNASRGGVRTGS